MAITLTILKAISKALLPNVFNSVRAVSKVYKIVSAPKASAKAIKTNLISTAKEYKTTIRDFSKIRSQQDFFKFVANSNVGSQYINKYKKFKDDLTSGELKKIDVLLKRAGKAILDNIIAPSQLIKDSTKVLRKSLEESLTDRAFMAFFKELDNFKNKNKDHEFTEFDLDLLIEEFEDKIRDMTVELFKKADKIKTHKTDEMFENLIEGGESAYETIRDNTPFTGKRLENFVREMGEENESVLANALYDINSVLNFMRENGIKIDKRLETLIFADYFGVNPVTGKKIHQRTRKGKSIKYRKNVPYDDLVRLTNDSHDFREAIPNHVLRAKQQYDVFVNIGKIYFERVLERQASQNKRNEFTRLFASMANRLDILEKDPSLHYKSGLKRSKISRAKYKRGDLSKRKK